MSSRNRDSFNEINITPLTDIFLVLLIIMMVIAPLLDQQGLNLTVPEVVKQENMKESKIITVLVSNDNKYFIQGQEVAAEALTGLLEKQKIDNPEGLLIQSEPESTHGAVVKLMDIARSSGITSISVVEG